MPGLFVITPGARISLVSERLRVETPVEGGEPGKYTGRDVPLHDLEQVLVNERIALTVAAMNECMRRNIPILFTDQRQHILGVCRPPLKHAAIRLAQYRCLQETSQCLGWARALVEAKILNARRVLQRVAANRENLDVRESLKDLSSLASAASRATAVDTLRGYEGAGAGKYFETLGRLFPESAPFERRSRRPPLNAPNAVLSYGYTLMTGEMELSLAGCGLDPSLGIYHESENGRCALALDGVEPFRAPLADALALDLFTHGTLKSDEHFEAHDGGVFLNAEGKKRFFVAYERRMTRTFVSEQHGERTTLRGEFRRMALSLKQAILDGTPFRAYRMN